MSGGSPAVPPAPVEGSRSFVCPMPAGLVAFVDVVLRDGDDPASLKSPGAGGRANSGEFTRWGDLLRWLADNPPSGEIEVVARSFNFGRQFGWSVFRRETGSVTERYDYRSCADAAIALLSDYHEYFPDEERREIRLTRNERLGGGGEADGGEARATSNATIGQVDEAFEKALMAGGEDGSADGERRAREVAAEAVIFAEVAERLLRGGSPLADVMFVATMNADSECEVCDAGLRELRRLALEFAPPVTDDVGVAILASLVALAHEVAVNEHRTGGLYVAAERLTLDALDEDAFGGEAPR